VRASDFHFDLPATLVAQRPSPQREGARLMVVHRASGNFEHRQFPELLEFLTPKDLLILNDTRVIPARLRGVNARTGGRFELLLLEELAPNDWWAMVRPGKRAREGTKIRLQTIAGAKTEVEATVIAQNSEGHRRLVFSGVKDILESIEQLGEVPLPPYISRSGPGELGEDRERYQTVYANVPGSVAAPTAGLHFSRALLDRIRTHNVPVAYVTLHVGFGTFAPVKSEELSTHSMHEERYEISEATAALVRNTRERGGRVIAVGTTTLRVLESVASRFGSVVEGAGRTRIFIYPPYVFKAVDALVTNFHLPRSTLLMLASAFAAPGEVRGREMILRAYVEAIKNQYRFFSYGDAMLIL
jgi:S-adenosylmethionine:tRNA ribosyltransferase-isomerase